MPCHIVVEQGIPVLLLLSISVLCHLALPSIYLMWSAIIISKEIASKIIAKIWPGFEPTSRPPSPKADTLAICQRGGLWLYKFVRYYGSNMKLFVHLFYTLLLVL